MTVYNVLAVRDRALNAFMQPLFTPAVGVAIRSFSDEVNRQDSPMFSHPEDYDLYDIGLYDDEAGQLQPATPRMVCVGKDVHRGHVQGGMGAVRPHGDSKINAPE